MLGGLCHEEGARRDHVAQGLGSKLRASLGTGDWKIAPSGTKLSRLHHCTDPKSGEPYLTWNLEWESFHEKITDLAVQTKWEGIGETLRKLPVCRECFGFIHNDPHLWNMRVDGDRVTLLDFDVATHHWFANDIAITCQHVLNMLSGGLSSPLHHPDD